MRKSRLLSLLLLAITFITVSCTKEGPEGPVGATGAQGPAGSNGATGTPGTPGAGISTYSTWYTTLEADWTDEEPLLQYTASFRYDRAAPGVTQAIIDQGIVLAYMKTWVVDGFPRATETAQLPYLVDNFFLDQYDFVVPAPGTIRFLYKSGLPWEAEQLAGTAFRYVLISGSVAGGRGIDGQTTYSGYTKTQLKAMPYEEVARIFNIPPSGSNIQ